jgi:hypothetical protein
MTAKAPPIPPAQAAAHGAGPSGADARGASGRDINTNQQGRSGNLHQNVETVRARTQDR